MLSLSSSYAFLPPLYPQFSSLCLNLYSCPVNRLIATIFLDSIYMHCAKTLQLSGSVTLWTIAHQALCPWRFSRQEYWSRLPCPPPGNLPNLGIEPRSPMLQVDSLPSESQGKPNNTGMGSLALLQEIFLTQESNWGLLHCRWILYQLNYQGSPCFC